MKTFLIWIIRWQEDICQKHKIKRCTGADYGGTWNYCQKCDEEEIY
jgi:hypothetical protein